MDVKVRFRFNKQSGEVEHFEVDQDSTLPSVEHEREHDRLAAEIGALLERLPRVTELLPGAGALETTEGETPAAAAEDEEASSRRQPARETEK